MAKPIRYPYDTTGTAISNQILNEKYTLTPVNGPSYQFIVIRKAPYFRTGVRVIHTSSQRELKVGIDYICSHYIKDISQELQKQLYASLTFLNKKLSGQIEITYQTLGGVYVTDELELAQSAINYLESDGKYDWNELEAKPEEYPPMPHQVNTTQIYGVGDVVDAINNITFKPEHEHAIAHVIGLSEVLETKISNSGNQKFLSEHTLEITNTQTGSIAIRLSKHVAVTLVRATIYMSMDDQLRTLIVAGLVKPFNDGTVDDTWEHIHAKSVEGSIIHQYRCSYDDDHYPTIYIGKQDTFTNVTVALAEVFVSDNALVDDEQLPYRIYNTESPLLPFELPPSEVIAHTHEIEDIIGLPEAIAQIEQDIDAVSRSLDGRFDDVFYPGIYSGFYTRLIDNTVEISYEATGRNIAVVDIGDMVITVYMRAGSEILTIPGPGHWDVALSVSKAQMLETDTCTTDVKGYRGELKLVTRGNALETEVIVCSILWPFEEPQMLDWMLTNKYRQEAYIGSNGTVTGGVDGGSFIDQTTFRDDMDGGTF